MDRNSFFNEILPGGFKLNSTYDDSGPDKLKVHDGKTNIKKKDINFIKKIAREKVKINGAPVKYFPIDLDEFNSLSHSGKSLNSDNVLGDHTDLVLGAPIDMIATWTPQEYQMDLSKWGVMMPSGSDQQLFFHVDEISEKLGRKPLLGDIIETVRDVTRYKIADVFYGHANLWENIFCMVTLSKVTYDNYTAQLDKYDEPGENYDDTYTKLEEVLNVMDGTASNASNSEIKEQKLKTTNRTKPAKRSIDTGLDIMTMTL